MFIDKRKPISYGKEFTRYVQPKIPIQEPKGIRNPHFKLREDIEIRDYGIKVRAPELEKKIEEKLQVPSPVRYIQQSPSPLLIRARAEEEEEKKDEPGEPRPGWQQFLEDSTPFLSYVQMERYPQAFDFYMRNFLPDERLSIQRPAFGVSGLPIQRKSVKQYLKSGDYVIMLKTKQLRKVDRS